MGEKIKITEGTTVSSIDLILFIEWKPTVRSSFKAFLIHFSVSNWSLGAFWEASKSIIQNVYH